MNAQQHTAPRSSPRGEAGPRREARWTNGLGWFSLGLGAAEVIAPRTMARLIGVDGKGSPGVLRAYGLREIAAGVGILSQPEPVGWMWGRVAGDLMDLASLGSAARSRDANRARIAAATTAVLGVTALDLVCSAQLSKGAQLPGMNGRARASRSIVIGRSPEEVYNFWRNFDNLRASVDWLDSVQTMENGRSHWKIRVPPGKTVEWDAETIADQPGSHISWRSLEGSDIQIAGSVWFEKAPGDRGTLVRLQFEYGPSLPALAGKAGKFLGAGPGDLMETVLRRFKQQLETGEIAKSDASVHWAPRAAQPSPQHA
jgi:uncharacterized membrane protein